MIVVSGASGKIGSRISSQLLEKGKNVKVLGRTADSLAKLKTAGAEVALGNLDSVDFLRSAFAGAEAVFLMLPPDKDSLNFGMFQDAIAEAQVEALRKENIKHVVFLSSQGAHDILHTGTVKGLGRQELRLNALPSDVNVLSLRPEAFMENTIESLKLFNTVASPLRPEISTGQIATADIADFAAKKLIALNFVGKTHQDLLGDRDYTQTEIAQIVGKALGKPDLEYKHYSYEDYKKVLVKAGVSQSRAELITERYKAINEGYFNKGVRDQTSTTPTSFEAFSEHVLKPMFLQTR